MTDLQDFINALKEADPNITQEEIDRQVELFLMLSQSWKYDRIQ